MALEPDAFAVFRGIGSHRTTFETISADIAKAARTLVVKLIKDKKTDLARLREIRKALGAESLNLIVDSMADAQIKTVVAKLDKHNVQFKTADAPSLRLHFLALADASVDPAEKQKSSSSGEKPGKPPKPRKLERISFVSAGATRKR
jgi:hypothetical protein